MSNKRHNCPAVTLSVRISPEVRNQLENLSDATHRTKSFLAAEAIDYYLTTQAWQAKSVQKSIDKADSREANFISHTKVVDWLHSWGTEDETDLPTGPHATAKPNI